METDKRYFIEGLFILGLSLAAALFFVWLSSSGHRDDVLYRIRFSESVSGLSLGDPVKYRGVDVGTVRSMALDAGDPRTVQVDVKLRRNAPINTETRASLRLKGITGVVYIELDGGGAGARTLLAATPAGEVPEIPAVKSDLANVIEQLPKVIDKFSAIENRTNKVLADVGEVTQKVKENPSLLLRRPKGKPAGEDR
jgi:phospholipid/cholesterol/gamma-HCH transport system substrate-binding protein